MWEWLMYRYLSFPLVVDILWTRESLNQIKDLAFIEYLLGIIWLEGWSWDITTCLGCGTLTPSLMDGKIQKKMLHFCSNWRNRLIISKLLLILSNSSTNPTYCKPYDAVPVNVYPCICLLTFSFDLDFHEDTNQWNVWICNSIYM